MGMFGSAMKAMGGTGASDILTLLGATMKDMSPGNEGNIAAARSMMAKRQQGAAEMAWRNKVRGMFGSGAPGAATPAPPVTNDAGADITSAFGPQADSAAAAKGPNFRDMLPLLTEGALQGYDGAKGIATMAHQAEGDTASRIVEGPDGIYRVGPDGAPVKIQSYPAPSPNGYRRRADGGLEFIPGGPADPRVIGSQAGVRRDAVVSRPTPSRARATSHAAHQISWD